MLTAVPLTITLALWVSTERFCASLNVESLTLVGYALDEHILVTLCYEHMQVYLLTFLFRWTSCGSYWVLGFCRGCTCLA